MRKDVKKLKESVYRNIRIGGPYIYSSYPFADYEEIDRIEELDEKMDALFKYLKLDMVTVPKKDEVPAYKKVVKK